MMTCPSDPVEITVLGKPAAWKRPRLNRANATFYLDRESENYRAIIREACRQPMGGRPPFDCPVELSVLAVMPIPQLLPKHWKGRVKQRDWFEWAKSGLVPCVGGLDLDNIIKALKDSLTGVVYRDDRLASSYGACAKIYGERPRLEVRVAPIEVKAAALLGRPLEHEPDLFAGATA